MPANRKATFGHRSDKSRDMLSIEVDGDLECRRSVYFTDQNPEFEVNITNVSDGSISGKVISRVEFDESDENYGSDHSTTQIELNAGESTTGTLSPDIMSYQGHAAVRIDDATVRESDGEHDYETRKSSGNRRTRVYTFMVYDRDYYKVNYLLPRYSQYIAAVLSVLIVAVGIIQIVKPIA